MKNLIITATIACIAACGGPSGRDVAMAKQARYAGDKLQLFSIVKQTVEGKFKLEVSDETKLAVKTTGRWYTPDGLVSNWSPEDARGSTDSTRRGTPDRSVNVSMVAQLLPQGEHFILHVEPVVLRFHEGQPKFEPVRPDDPSMPGFVRSKTDELVYDIYQKLKPYELKSPTGQLAPPPANPDQAPPQPETPAAGSAGSASPPPP